MIANRTRHFASSASSTIAGSNDCDNKVTPSSAQPAPARGNNDAFTNKPRTHVNEEIQRGQRQHQQQHQYRK